MAASTKNRWQLYATPSAYYETLDVLGRMWDGTIKGAKECPTTSIGLAVMLGQMFRLKVSSSPIH